MRRKRYWEVRSLQEIEIDILGKEGGRRGQRREERRGERKMEREKCFKYERRVEEGEVSEGIVQGRGEMRGKRMNGEKRTLRLQAKEEEKN